MYYIVRHNLKLDPFLMISVIYHIPTNIISLLPTNFNTNNKKIDQSEANYHISLLTDLPKLIIIQRIAYTCPFTAHTYSPSYNSIFQVHFLYSPTNRHFHQLLARQYYNLPVCNETYHTSCHVLSSPQIE